MPSLQERATGLARQSFEEGWTAEKTMQEIMKLMGDYENHQASEIQRMFAQGLIAVASEKRDRNEEE